MHKKVWVVRCISIHPFIFSLTFLSLAQAIGDGGQGWANFFLYVIVSDKVRTKLLHCCTPDLTPNDLQENSSASYPLDPGANINYGTVQKKWKSKQGKKEEVDYIEPTTT